MKTKLSEILVIDKIIKEIVEKSSDIDLKTKFNLLGVLKGIENYIVNFELIRAEKIKEYGKENSETGEIIVEKDTEEYKKFISEMEELIQAEIEISDSYKIPISDLEKLNLSATVLTSLYPIIKPE